MQRKAVRHTAAAVLILSLLFVGVTGASASSRDAVAKHAANSNTIVFSLPVVFATEFLPVEMAKLTGLFAKYGVNVDVQIVSDTALDAAIVAGADQFAIEAPPQLELAYQNKVPVKMIAMYGEHEQGYLLACPGIKTLADLEGKTIGTSGPTAFPTIITKYVLHSAGIPLNKETYYVLSPSANPVGYLISGEVDASEVNYQNVLQAKQELPGSTALYNVINIPWPCCSIWGNTIWMAKHKAETADVLKAINAAVIKWNSDPALAEQEIGTLQGLTEKSLLVAGYDATETILNKGSQPVVLPSTKDQAFVNSALRLVGYPGATVADANEGNEWTSAYWNAAFGKS